MKSHTPDGERDQKTPPRLLFHEYWLKLNPHLASILQTNLVLLDAQGHSQISTPNVTGSCSNFAIPKDDSIPAQDCVLEAFQQWPQADHYLYQCVHCLYYARWDVPPVGESPASSGKVLMMGPFLVGEREKEKTYHNFCILHGWNPELFCDRVRELRLYSQEGIEQTYEFIRTFLESWRFQRTFLDKIPLHSPLA